MLDEYNRMALVKPTSENNLAGNNINANHTKITLGIAVNNSMSSSNGNTKVIAGYELREILGSGSFGTVYKGLKQKPSLNTSNSNSTSNDDCVAVKVIARNTMNSRKGMENLEREIGILFQLKHTNIVSLIKFQKSKNNYYLLFEYCRGGDLKLLVHSRKSGRLTERLTRRLMKDLASALKFLWQKQFIHRDIKPQNLLLSDFLPIEELNDNPPKEVYVHTHNHHDTTTTTTTSNVGINSKFCLKIADFGFARHLQSQSLAETLCGSPLYMAPEVLKQQRYDQKADLWSVGSVLFEMITGTTPFEGENHMDLIRRMNHNSVRLPKNLNVSTECKKLLKLLLTREPEKRGSFQDFLQATDAFVSLGCNDSSTEKTTICSTEKTLSIKEESNFGNESTTVTTQCNIQQKITENYYASHGDDCNSHEKRKSGSINSSNVSTPIVSNCNLNSCNNKLEFDEDDFVMIHIQDFETKK